jgi:hypothetical protein
MFFSPAEQNILKILDFSVAIKSKEYVEIYFELRKNVSDRSEWVKPLDDNGVRKLEVWIESRVSCALVTHFFFGLSLATAAFVKFGD